MSCLPVPGWLHIQPFNMSGDPQAGAAEAMSIEIIEICFGLQVAEFCRKQDVKLVVVGPEAPLVAGLTDSLTGEGIE